MVWGGAVEGNFFRVEGRVGEHSCLPAQVSTSCPLTTASPLAPVQPPYFMPPTAPTHFPLVPHRLHVAAPPAPAASTLNSLRITPLDTHTLQHIIDCVALPQR